MLCANATNEPHAALALLPQLTPWPPSLPRCLPAGLAVLSMRTLLESAALLHEDEAAQQAGTQQAEAQQPPGPSLAAAADAWAAQQQLLKQLQQQAPILHPRSC